MSDMQTNRERNDNALAWHDHDGGPMPVRPKTRVIVRYRCGALSEPIEAGTHRWESWPSEIGDTAFDIVAWRHV